MQIDNEYFLYKYPKKKFICYELIIIYINLFKSRESLHVYLYMHFIFTKVNNYLRKSAKSYN